MDRLRRETHCVVLKADVDAIARADEAARCVGIVDRRRTSWVVDVTPRVACTHVFNGIRTWCDTGRRCAEGEVERALGETRVSLVAGLYELWRDVIRAMVLGLLVVARAVTYVMWSHLH